MTAHLAPTAVAQNAATRKVSAAARQSTGRLAEKAYQVEMGYFFLLVVDLLA